MDKAQLEDLSLRHKSDFERAEAITRLGYPVIEPILPQLMEWLQDYNWPITNEVIAPFLSTIGLPLAPEIRRIFQTDDAMWKYWTLHLLVSPSLELREALYPDLSEIASLDIQSEDEEGFVLLAREIISSLEQSPPSTKT